MTNDGRGIVRTDIKGGDSPNAIARETVRAAVPMHTIDKWIIQGKTWNRSVFSGCCEPRFVIVYCIGTNFYTQLQYDCIYDARQLVFFNYLSIVNVIVYSRRTPPIHN